MMTTDPITTIKAKTTPTIANMPSPAARKVFAIPELLEHILLCTNTREVLRCKRLSHHTKAVINESVALQRHAFTIPQPRQWFVDVKVQELPETSEEYPIKPFFKPAESITYSNTMTNENEEPSDNHRRVAMKHVNDVLFSVPDDRRPHEICCGGGGWEYCQACDLAHRHLRKDFFQADIVFNLDTPLPQLARNMHITQPPTTMANLCMTDLGGEGVILEQTVENESGLRVQDIIDGTKALLERNKAEKTESTGFWLEIAKSSVYHEGLAEMLIGIGEKGIACTRFAEGGDQGFQLAVVPHQDEEDEESSKSHAARQKLRMLTKEVQVESRDDGSTIMTVDGAEQTEFVMSCEEPGSKVDW